MCAHAHTARVVHLFLRPITQMTLLLPSRTEKVFCLPSAVGGPLLWHRATRVQRLEPRVRSALGDQGSADAAGDVLTSMLSPCSAARQPRPCELLTQRKIVHF